MKALNPLRRIPDTQEVRSRAAEIRKRWSPAERQRRTGLPPDAPFRLRQFVLEHPLFDWQTARTNPRAV
jgi:hypothetical protein